jgi:LmbE family N-acetylglucosaminyl deacetylase
MNKTALAFLAHPDDAEFVCAGTLIRLKSLGWSIHIATATRGDCGTMTHTRKEISAIRTSEATEAAKLIGATYDSIDERDLMVVYDKPTIQKTIDLFRSVAPSLIFTHAPKDYMMDHEVVSLLARCASFGYGAPNASAIPRSPRSMVPHLYYCDPPEGIDPLGNAIVPTTYVEITEQMPLKTQMLACHASQREWLRAHHGMDEYVDAMKRHSARRGEQRKVDYAEAFVQHRGHSYPHDDLLASLFPI